MNVGTNVSTPLTWHASTLSLTLLIPDSVAKAFFCGDSGFGVKSFYKKGSRNVTTFFWRWDHHPLRIMSGAEAIVRKCLQRRPASMMTGKGFVLLSVSLLSCDCCLVVPLFQVTFSEFQTALRRLSFRGGGCGTT